MWPAHKRKRSKTLIKLTQNCVLIAVHGNMGKQSTARIRHSECPAFSHKCDHCKRDHHLESMCRSRDNIKRPPRARQSRPSNNENAVFDFLCTLFDDNVGFNLDGCINANMCTVHKSTHGNNEYSDSNRCINDTMFTVSKGSYIDSECFESNCFTNDNVCKMSMQSFTVPLEHHEFDTLSDTWVRRNSKPQPSINVDIQTISQDYSELGLDDMNVGSASAVTVPAIADTGCQSCLTRLKVINRLGLGKSDLVPVTMKMPTANNEGIIILGAVLLRISCHSLTGDLLQPGR